MSYPASSPPTALLACRSRYSSTHHVRGRFHRNGMNSMSFRAKIAGAVLMLAASPLSSQRPAVVAPREEAYRANNLGASLLEQFKFDEAAAAFREALRREPNLGIAHLNLSIALLQNADFEAARGEAEAA